VIPGQSGILVDRSPGSTVESNRVVGASSNQAVGSRGAGVEIRESTGMIVRNNVLIANDDEGLLFSFGRGSVTSNSATGNGGSGIVLCGSAVTLADNQARDNRNYGFVTTAGFTDGGGNQALDNGLEPQWNTDGC
jgi:parallel beta-helix repeat protein